MNEKVKQALKTLQELSGLALKYLVDNFNYKNKDYLKLKLEIGNLTDRLRFALIDFDKYYESQQDLIKGKDEYIAKLCNDRAELKAHEKELIAEQNRLFDLCKEQEKAIAQLTEADYYFITSMALDMLKGDSNFALMYIDDIFCLVDTKDNKFDVIDNYDIDTENIGKSKYQEFNQLKEFTRIVFDKNVFIWGMAYRKNEVKDYKPTYEYYKNNCGYFHSGYRFELMTETEFDLVKKVVEKYGQ